MLILGIETSCDETSCAALENGSRVLANVIFSQVKLHAKTGGVVPEVAAREHALRIVPVLMESFKKAKIAPEKIDFVAVTRGPGLLSSLLMGNVAANTLSLCLKKPILPVHHIEGHLYANFLERKPPPRFPILVLTVSGGHNELILWNGHGRYKFLGETLDDAAGEAFDKVARLLSLGYPGGPVIEKAARDGDATKYALPRAWLDPWLPHKNRINFNFSFSGLKTAVNRLVHEHAKNIRTTSTRKKFVSDVAASFQESVTDVLSEKLLEAVKRYDVHEVHLAGGVSANKALRNAIQEKLNTLEKSPIFRYPIKMEYCTDNAAMIACAGYFKYKKLGKRALKTGAPVMPDPNLDIKNW